VERVKKYGKWHILLALLTGVIMGPLDASIVYIALPSIAQHFNVDPQTVGWVSMSYLLVMGSFLLAFGRLGDMFGFRRLYLTGLLLFVTASAFCGLSPSLGWLISLRALQALGAGLTMAMAPAITTAAFPPEERGKALGITGMAVALGLALGPSIGGMLVEIYDWRLIFYVNIPIGIVAYFWCLKVLPDKLKEEQKIFDWQGAVLGFGALSTMLFFASRGQAVNWSWPVLLTGMMSLILLAGFVIVEKRVSDPMLDLNLFKNRVFSAGCSTSLLNFMTQYIIVFMTPFLLQEIMGYTVGQAGAIMTAFPLTVLVVAPVSGALSDKIGQRWLAFTGSLLCTLAAIALSNVERNASPLDVAWRLSLFGMGTGMFQSPITSAVMGSVPKFRLGIAAGVLSTTRNIGMVLGIAAGGAVLAVRQAFYSSRADAYQFGIRDAYLAAFLLSLACTLTTLLLEKPEANEIEGKVNN
jgi:EmrB/QacA subfamily drug resistance transporter